MLYGVHLNMHVNQITLVVIGTIGSCEFNYCYYTMATVMTQLSFRCLSLSFFVDIKRKDHLLKPVSFCSITIQFHFNINSIDQKP